MNELHSVVITGLGAVTARGDMTSHPSPIPAAPDNVAPDASSLGITGFKIENYLTSQKTYLDRCTALALAGSALALRAAGVEWPVPEHGWDAHAFGIVLGTHLGCIETMKGFWDKAMERGVRHANPLLFSHSYFNTPISLCAIEFGLQGYHTTCCAGHESGLEAVHTAYNAIRLGHAQAVLAGGVEAITPTRTLCETPAADAAGSGEAAAFFLLEEQEHATQRGANIIAPVDEALFEAAITHRSAVRSSYGDCGGAESALCLALHLLNDHINHRDIEAQRKRS
ncbi:MAG: hypothetical protein JO316_08025 [Abitibacteriaceae bacterium]|nr:hypothetical protein [Abditibacteriaceae bacterium]